jgi:hypothetical protein
MSAVFTQLRHPLSGVEPKVLSFESLPFPQPGLPGGLFSNQKSQICPNFGGPLNVGIFYDHLEYFMAIWYNLRPFGTIYGRLVWFLVICYIFPQFGMFGPRKIWQTCPQLSCQASSSVFDE